MKSIILFSNVLLILFSCSTEGVKDVSKNSEIIKSKSTPKLNNKITALNSDNLKIIDSKSFDNGISISWLVKGKGEKINKSEVVLIDYKVTLDDGKIVDGNHFLKKESIPFVVGFQMQLKGWDFALQNLKVGDFVRVKIPSALARGVNGIKDGKNRWVIPPNADNFVSIHIVSKMPPTRVVDGSKVWLFVENINNKEKFDKNNSIIFHSIISSESNPFYSNSYRSNLPFQLRFNDKGEWPGLKKALINCKKADKMFVVVPASKAYGKYGLEGFVKPNEDVLYDILVMDVVKK